MPTNSAPKLGLTTIPSRKTRRLSDLLDKRLGAYVLSAGAGGVCMLALASPAEADSIVYTTPNQLLSGAGSLSFSLGSDTFTFTNSPFRRSQSVINTFTLTQSGSLRPLKIVLGSNFGSTLKVAAAGPGARVLATPLSSGAFVNRLGNIFTTQHFMGTYIASMKDVVSYNGPRFSGPWGNTSSFLGLQFDLNGQTAYGWAEVGVAGIAGSGDGDTPPSIGVELFGVAYNSCAGADIVTGETSNNVDPSHCQVFVPLVPTPTPEPSTLGLLAVGAAGLALWRKRNPEPKAD
jgi:hypothetical protein